METSKYNLWLLWLTQEISKSVKFSPSSLPAPKYHFLVQSMINNSVTWTIPKVWGSAINKSLLSFHLLLLCVSLHLWGSFYVSLWASLARPVFPFCESCSIRPEATYHCLQLPGKGVRMPQGADLAVTLAILHINNSHLGTWTFVSAVQENSFLAEKTHLLMAVIQAANFTEYISRAKFFLRYGGQRWGNCAYRAKLFYGFPWLSAFFFTTD